MNRSWDALGHFFIALTLLFTVYGQLVLKWQMGGAGTLPPGGPDKLVFLLRQFLNPWVVSGFVAAFLFAEIISLGSLFSDLEWGYVLAFAFFIVMMFVRPGGLLARRQ